MGPPAAGKTTYGKKLAAEKAAAFLDIDTATELVVRAGLKLANQNPDDRDSSLFKTAFRQSIYQTLFAIAKDNLGQVDVVIVGPFTQEARDVKWVHSLKGKLEANVRVHFVSCDAETRGQRMRERGNPRDLAKLADWERHIQYYSGDEPPLFPHKFINTSSPSTH